MAAASAPNPGRNGHFLGVAKLVAQRGGAQGVVFLSTLFAAKYATPSVFGQVGLFTSLCSFFAMAAGLRFEIRGLVCKQASTRDRFIGMAYASNLCLLAFGLLLVGACFLASEPPAWLLLVPAGILLSSLIQYVLPAQNSAIHQLGKLGWMTQVVASVTALGQVASALLAPTAIALIGSRVLGWLAGALFMLPTIVRGLRHAASLKRRDAKRILLSSRHEILYGVSASVVSVVTLQIPVYIFTWHSMLSQVGLYWLSFNLLFVPYLIVSSSTRPIFLRYISAWRGSDLAYSRMKRLTLLALMAGCVISLVLAGACWVIVRFFLSPDWQDASRFSLALSPLLATLIAQTPISFSISAFGLQRANLIGGFMQVIFRALAILIALRLTYSPVVAIGAFSIVSALTYAAYVFYCLKLIRARNPERR